MWRLRIALCVATVLLSTTIVEWRSDAQMPEPEDRPAPAFDGTFRRIYAPILMYHYVSPLPDDADDLRIGLTVNPDRFRQQMQYLQDSGFTPISLYELHSALQIGTALPSRPVVLTFDDSYVDHYQYVFPLLRELGFTGTFFVITQRSDSGNPNHLTWEQITEMSAAGMSMEAHTKDHIGLRGRDRETLIYQVLGSIESLAAHTGVIPHMFSYPAGQYDDFTLSVITEMPVWRAVTTQGGARHTTDNYLEMPRVRVTNDMSGPSLVQILVSFT